MYKIYINDNIIELRETKNVKKGKSPEGSLLAPYSGKKKTLLSYIDMLEKTNRFKLIVLYHDDLKKLWKDFKSLFTIIKAGGGVVKNEENEVLFIYRKGHWDLPKGKMDPGEKKKQTAIREVEEETGVKNLVLNEKIIITYHIYKLKSPKRALKKTFWYSMTAPKQPLIPQAKEDITKAEWHIPTKLSGLENETYKSILHVMDAYLTKT